MKGGINMEADVRFVVLKIEEQDLNLSPYKVSVEVVGSFKNLEDAKKCKEAKDTLNNLTPNEFDWCYTQFKVQQIFYKSFVQADKKSA
jgi:hypothetical protein